jgi:AraC family transcriptional activator FtrA
MRTLSDMTSVVLALYDGALLFEAAAACEVFGVDRGLADPWYDFRVCGPHQARLGDWLRIDTPHGLGALADADTVIVSACGDVEADPPADLVDAVRAAHDRGARLVSLCTGALDWPGELVRAQGWDYAVVTWAPIRRRGR